MNFWIIYKDKLINHILKQNLSSSSLKYKTTVSTCHFVTLLCRSNPASSTAAVCGFTCGCCNWKPAQRSAG